MGDIFSKLERLRVGLESWARQVKGKMIDLKNELTRKLELLMEIDRNDVNLGELIDRKIQLIWEIEKVKVFLEQQVGANWLKVGDKNMAFFHRYAS